MRTVSLLALALLGFAALGAIPVTLTCGPSSHRSGLLWE